jgi:hypothetical protein
MNKSQPWQQAVETQVELYTSLRTRKPPLDEKGRYELRLETRKLLDAPPVFVTSEMCQLIEMAAPTFKREPWQESDLLTSSGFVLFAQTIELYEGTPGDQVLMPYGALSWWGVVEREGATPFAVHLAFYVDMHALVERAPELVRAHERDLPRLDLWKTTNAGIDGECVGSELEQLAATTLRLMREFRPAQRHSSRERPDRATRKRAKRAGLVEHDVLVVRLRREGKLSERLGGSVDYAHRFMVSGHWRNQWYPSLHRHRQVWVTPYVKGPADKPFKPPLRRVFNFDR